MDSLKDKKDFKIFGNFSGFVEETSCPICIQPPSPKLLYKKKEGIKIFQCPQCSVFFASPRFDKSSVDAIYENDSFSDIEFYKKLTKDEWLNCDGRGQNVAKLKSELIKKFVPEYSRVLDVGCGVGEFVCVAINNNLKAEGIDISNMLITTGRSQLEVPIYQTDVKDYHPDHSFDAIIIWDVLEHLIDPVEVLEACYSLLNKNGFIFAQVPNYKGLSNKLKSLACRTGISKNDYGHFGFPYHLYSFDQKSLSLLFKKAGFSPIHFESWSHLLKNNDHGIYNDFIISMTKKYCLSDYIIGVGKKL